MEQMRLTHQTRLFMEVDVEFILQPPETLPDVALPLAVDITGVFITIKTAQDKPRRVNILSALSDSDIINLEDDILTPEFVNNYYKVLEWQKKLS